MGQNINLVKSWDPYLKKCYYFLKASGITKEEQRQALLLHISGQEIQDVFETLTDTGTTLQEAADKITAYFLPKKNISFEHHVFSKTIQQPQETVDQYIA